MADEFFRTMMGRRHYEGTMPKIADELHRLNKNLEAIVAKLRRPCRCPCAARASVPPTGDVDHASAQEPPR